MSQKSESKQPSRHDRTSPQQTSKTQLGSGHAPRIQNVNKESCVTRDCAPRTDRPCLYPK